MTTPVLTHSASRPEVPQMFDRPLCRDTCLLTVMCPICDRIPLKILYVPGCPYRGLIPQSYSRVVSPYSFFFVLYQTRKVRRVSPVLGENVLQNYLPCISMGKQISRHNRRLSLVYFTTGILRETEFCSGEGTGIEIFSFPSTSTVPWGLM